MRIYKIYDELKRRNVFRVATAYAVSAWLIIQIVVSVFPYLGIPDFWITVLIVLLLIGFPISMIVGWIFEFTSDGFIKTDEVELTAVQEAQSDKKLNRIIISGLSLALLFLLVERVFFAESALIERDILTVQTASIAVLPFVDMSQNQDQEYFSDGLSEELLNVLAKVEGLQVAGRTSSFKYKGKNLDLREIGEELGVDHVLEGSIRKAGNQIRITTQLIKANDGFHLWSETYDREFSANELFQIQDEISHQVLQELEIHLLPDKEKQISKQLTQNTQAYDLYLKATQLLVNRRASEIEQAIDLFGQVIEQDPTFAVAYARRAIAYDLLTLFGNLDQQEMLNLMRQDIDRALLLDANLGWAYAALGRYYYRSGDMEPANIALKKAFELVPSDPEIMIWYAYTVNYETYIQLVNRAYKIDPFSPQAISTKARIHYELDEFEEAFSLMEMNIEKNPEYSLSLSLKAEFIKDQPYGNLDESFILSYQAYLKEPGNLNYMFELAEISFDLGFFSIVDSMHREIKAAYPNNETYLESRYDYFFYTQQYNQMLTILDTLVQRELIELDDPYYIEAYLAAFIHGNMLEEGRSYLNTNFPEIEQLDIDYDWFYSEDIAWASLLYEKLGENEKASQLAEIACKIIAIELDHDGDINKEITQDLFDFMDCLALRKDKKAVREIIENIHFERKSKANLYTFLDTNPIFDFLRKDPEYRILRERIEEDIRGMRTNAKVWLKENGHWQDDWVVTQTDY